jgi:periplasmic divalent cation tolerance protein
MKRRKLIVALTTVADEATAESLARTLVEERLAACVNRVEVASTYRWKGSIERERELLLVIKSTADLVERLRERIRALHTYDVPEFVVLEAAAVGSDYLAWALSSCGDAE